MSMVIKSKKSPLQAAETRALGSPEGSNAMLPSGRRSRGFPAQAKSIQETISAACGRVVGKCFCLLAVSFLGLAGCVVSQPESDQVLVHSVACYPETQAARASMLAQKGIQVDVLGDNVFLTLPLSEAFSNAASATVDSGFQSTASLIAQFLQCYNLTTTTVMVDNDVLSTRAQNQAISEQQAQAIMDMLWNAGLMDNVMVASGGGNSTKQDKAGDRRIGITTRLRGGAE